MKINETEITPMDWCELVFVGIVPTIIFVVFGVRYGDLVVMRVIALIGCMAAGAYMCNWFYGILLGKLGLLIRELLDEEETK